MVTLIYHSIVSIPLSLSLDLSLSLSLSLLVGGVKKRGEGLGVL